MCYIYNRISVFSDCEMNKLWTIPFACWLLVSCGSVNDSAEKTGRPLLGGDRDKHGCIRSAGYTWSEARQDCIRLFEVGVRLRISDNPASTTSAFVVFSIDSLQAEVFPPEGKSCLLKRKGAAWKGSKYQMKKGIDGRWTVTDRHRKAFYVE